jgi:DNA polymerase I-like protein with 3'-5' exonuclease and polymerase domains
MGKNEASMQLGISAREAAIGLVKFHGTNPNIQKVFHYEIIEFLRNNNRMLTNPFGRQRQFLNKWGDELFKEAYAQIPQSTVSDHVKFAMIRIEKRVPELMILEESHDSFLGQVPLLINHQYPFKILDKFKQVNKEEMEMPIDFSGCSLPRGELIIPTDLHIGKKNWEVMEVY